MKIYKKTALDDDASIYQKREEKTEKEKWAAMNSEERRQYFREYYLLKCVAGILAIGIAVFLIWHFVGPKEETVLYVAVIDELLDEEKTEQMGKELREFLGADGKYQKVIIDDSFFTQKDALSKLEVYLHSGQIDVVIADRTVYQEYAGYGFFQSMDEILDEKEKGKYCENFLLAAGYKDSDDITFEDEETGQGEECPYGVDISDSSRFGEVKNYIESPVFSIAQGAQNTENAMKFLDYLMQKGE
ncbi:MAG: hypothetical protein ACI4F1_11410 [Bariatricus sp.]